MSELVHEFAIDPDAILSISDIRYLDEATGWSKGRLISEFPSEWCRLISERLGKNGIADVKITHFLNLLKRKSGRFGRPKKIEGDLWYQAALREHGKKPFRAIISRSKVTPPECVLDLDELSSELPLWKISTSAAIPREAKEIAEAFSLLLKYSPSIYLIDPHFDPTTPKHRRPLQAICQAALNENQTQPKEVFYHLKAKRDTKVFEQDCLNELPFLISKGVKVTFLLWNERLGGQSFHDRFICFKYGSASFGHGLDDNPSSEDIVNVQLLDEEAHKLRFIEMDPVQSPFDLVHKFTLEGKR
jgi:hypothetical protein